MNSLTSSLIKCVTVVIFMGLCCPAPVISESQKAEVNYTGTVTHHDFAGVYFIDVEEVVEGPPPLWNNVMVNYFRGYRDENIQPGDRVEVFGTLYWVEDEQAKGYSISLEKPEHFIKRIKEDIPPVLEVYWNTLDFYTLGQPFELAVTVCNTGEDASFEATAWLSDTLIEPATWYIPSRRCVTAGWLGRSGPILEESHVQNGYIAYRVAVAAENEYGIDTYDETRYFPVRKTSQDPGSVTIFTREKCGRPLTAAIFLDGEYKGQTDSEGKLCTSGLSPAVYQAVAVGTEEYTEIVTTIEAKTATIVCLFLEKKRNTPRLKVTPPVLRFEPLNCGEEKTLTFQIENSGAGFLFWHITDDREWITTRPEYGLVGEPPLSVNVVVNAAKMEAGSYTGDVTIESNGGVEYVVITVSVVSSTDATTFLGIFLVSVTLLGLAALFKRKTPLRIKKLHKKMRVHILLFSMGICFLVILCIILRQNRVGLPALHIQSLLFLVTLLFFVLSLITYLLRRSNLDRVFVRFIWKLFFAMVVVYGLGSMILNQFALGLITELYLTIFSLSIGYFVVFLFVLSFALGMVMNLALARVFGKILSVFQKILNFWSYLQVLKPKKVSYTQSQELPPQEIQIFFYHVFELLIASFWIVLVYSMEIQHQANIMLIPIFVQLVPLMFTDLVEFLVPLIGFMLPLFILFPLFIAEDLAVGVDGKVVSPKNLHKFWSVITVLTFVVRAVSWGLVDFVAFLWALWLLLPIQSGLALGYMCTKEWANCVAKERADHVIIVNE